MQPKQKFFFYFSQTYSLNRKLTFCIFTILIVYLSYCWTFRLDGLPGLHGDEAWSGLEARHQFKPCVPRLTGMNYYTGQLQALLAAFFFRIGGITVFDLRIGGVIFNFFGLIIIWFVLYQKISAKSSLIFLLVISQSALYSNSPRVAWEVNSLTLFFSSLVLLFITRIVEKQRASKLMIILTLSTFVIGSYNHIIFSVVPVALALSFGIFFLLIGNPIYLKLSILCAIVVLDCSLQLLIFKYNYSGLFLTMLIYPIFAALMLLIQTYLLNNYIFRLSFSYSFKLNKAYIFYFYCVSLIPFAIFHGKAFFETLSNYKIYMQFYSHESPLWLMLLFSTIAIAVVSYLVMSMRRHFFDDKTLFYTLFLLSYTVIFTFYTRFNSYRYYLELYLIVSLYIIVTAPKFKGWLSSKLLIFALTISLFAAIYTQLSVFSSNMHHRALYFDIGNSQRETSAHFLSKEPLVMFLKKNRIDTIIDLTPNPYFLDMPLKFYKEVAPWKSIPGKKAVVMYQSTDSGKDGILFFIAK